MILASTAYTFDESTFKHPLPEMNTGYFISVKQNQQFFMLSVRPASNRHFATTFKSSVCAWKYEETTMTLNYSIPQSADTLCCIERAERRNCTLI